MIHFDDTIAAISTPLGQGGIGIVRLSGPESLGIANSIFVPSGAKALNEIDSHCLICGNVVDPSDGAVIDEALCSVMRSPHSYTREDVVEINCHGGMVPLRKILEAVISQGARMAEPGEFTKRAFLNGRINLTQAEAVSDLICAVTEESMRIAAAQLKGRLSEKLSELSNELLESCALTEAFIDFPEEEIDSADAETLRCKLLKIRAEIVKLASTFEEARLFREGLSVAIVGKPNVGKSSLLNALLKKDRAIVTEFPGTTRDIIEECLNINGLPLKIVDTAGIRKSDEAVEKEGIKRSIDAIETADFVVAVVDGSQSLKHEDLDILQRIKTKKAIVAVNKCDLPVRLSTADSPLSDNQFVRISALRGEGIEDLKSLIFRANLKNWKEEREGVVVSNIRHKGALDRSASALDRAVGLLQADSPLEIFSLELREAMDCIGEITGSVTAEDILNKIFDNFCIGK